MRRLFFTFFTLFFVSAYSQPVSVSDVESVVNRFLPSRYHYTAGDAVSIDDITPVSDESGIPVWFAVNLKPSGWVVISARKEAFPVLAYSFKGRYTGRNFPEGFEAWMGQYKRAVAWLQTGCTETIASNDAWRADHSFKARSRDLTPVEPFVNTSWDQGWPYNESCPPDPASGDGRCPTGCVPTAMAQIMFYYRWPVTGTGSYTYDAGQYGILSADFGATTYDWNSMGTVLKHSSPSAATLLSHLGISCDLVYGPTGSGMYNHKAAYSLKTYFKYSQDTRYIFRDSTNLRWDSLLIAHLDRRMPLYYAGWSVPNVNGHAFVCDGYQDTAFFHFNFGWSGSYDGYFNINQLYVGGSNFNLAQEVIVDCYPDTVNYAYPPQLPGSDTLSLFEGSGSDGSAPQGLYQPGTSKSWLIDPQTDIDSVESVTLQFHTFDLGNDADVVTVYDGTTAQSPVLLSLTGQHEPLTVTSTGNALLVTFEANGNTPGKGFVFSYEAAIPVWCTGTKTYTQGSGDLNDGSGRFYYYDKSRCIWKIQPPGASTVTLFIDAFNTEPDNDYLKVLDMTSGEVLGVLSGTYDPSNLPEPMVAGGKMMILFSTNDSVRNDGFSAHWEANNVGTGDGADTRELTLWPNPCRDRLFVYYPANTGDFMAEVYDLSGRKLLLPVALPKGENRAAFDLSGVKPGYYQLVLRLGDRVLRKQFVKL